MHIELSRIMNIIKLCLTTYFQFDGQYANKLEAYPWESLPGLIAEIAMQCLKIVALLCIQTKVWILYIHDTFSLMQKKKLQKTHETSNILKGIKFTRKEKTTSCREIHDKLETWSKYFIIKIAIQRLTRIAVEHYSDEQKHTATTQNTRNAATFFNKMDIHTNLSKSTWPLNPPQCNQYKL